MLKNVPFFNVSVIYPFSTDKVWLDTGEPYWLGLNDRRTEDTFVWLDENEKVRIIHTDNQNDVL